MKRSTIVYLIGIPLLIFIFIPVKTFLVFLSIPLFFYLGICFLEIYSPYSKEYTDDYFGHTMLKPKYNIIHKLNNLINK